MRCVCSPGGAPHHLFSPIAALPHACVSGRPSTLTSWIRRVALRPPGVLVAGSLRYGLAFRTYHTGGTGLVFGGIRRSLLEGTRHVARMAAGAKGGWMPARATAMSGGLLSVMLGFWLPQWLLALGLCLAGGMGGSHNWMQSEEGANGLVALGARPCAMGVIGGGCAAAART